MTVRPEWLAPTRFLDYEHPAVQAFVAEAVGDARTPRDQAVRLYYAVRDRIRYDPYRFHIEPENFAASETVRAGAAYCVPKALLYAAVLRAVGIPARPGFADVRNHLTTERLLAIAGTDVFSWHGYVSLLLDGQWVKATPAFNLAMCERFDVLPLEFDGTADSLLHPYNANDERHMEYVRQRGEYDDLPYDELAAEMRRTYPGLIAASAAARADDFEREAIHAGS
ncbi:MAG TPA: transglutaminase family protein [Rhodocyclaceae bacterium]|nr:transglutaminase family protein [Rhodocyclaceae bacterium]